MNLESNEGLPSRIFIDLIKVFCAPMHYPFTLQR